MAGDDCEVERRTRHRWALTHGHVARALNAAVALSARGHDVTITTSATQLL